MSTSDIGDIKKQPELTQNLEISSSYDNMFSSNALLTDDQSQKEKLFNSKNSIKEINDEQNGNELLNFKNMKEEINKTIITQNFFDEKYLPMLNSIRQNQKEKILTKFYEVPFFTKFDLTFLFRGNLSKEDWLSKTEKIRNYPQHLKNTLFYQYKNEQIKKIHNLDFSTIILICDKINQKGAEYFLKNEFSDALESFNHSYCLLKWIEFKEIVNENGIYKRPSPIPILDQNITERKISLAINDEEKYKACLIYILEMMAICYIELRHFSYAVQCFDECINIEKNNISDIYFGRAVARLKNRKISKKEVMLAKKDINKAIELIEKNNVKNPYYYLVKEELNKINENKLVQNTKYVKEIISEVYLSKHEETCSDYFNLNQKYQILKEIKNKYNLAVKYFYETKNKEQIKLTYEEFESFHEHFEKFKFFYKFEVDFVKSNNIKLSQKEISILFDPKNKEAIKNVKEKICDYIFSHSNYNTGLYQYAINKICNAKNQNKILKIFKWFDIFQFIINMIQGKYFVIYIFFIFVLLCLISILLSLF